MRWPWCDHRTYMRGIVDEKPIAARGVKATFLLPAGHRAAHIEAITPENPNAAAIKFQQTGDCVMFDVPEFLVYCLVRIKMVK